ncbi:MAG: hypothetical protein RL662_1233 [Bacteroidota bacterium]|jgi:S-adenosylmethionine:tRNA ribosyltransferase-isomerase
MELSNPQHIQIKEYNYELPDDRIAKYPLAERDNSQLLIYKDTQIQDAPFSSIADHLPQNSLMIFNNTKVIQARFYFRKSTGALIEIFCLDPHIPNDYNLVFQTTSECSWYCMIGNLKKWKEDVLIKEIHIANDTITLKASKKESNNNNYSILFSWDKPSYTFADILDHAGELPIPPYLNRETENKDKETYQTLYSKIKGSVAAPTAGLHFTRKTFESIEVKGIKTDEVTLHVGAGTFRPVKSERIEGHEMHSEFISVRRQTIEYLSHHQGEIIAVGTTSVRTLESLYYIGVLLEHNLNASELHVNQWLPYTGGNSTITRQRALDNILTYLNRTTSDTLLASTQIIIAPGYDFKMVNGIVTNFHQPQSTLLLLISAFVKGNWKLIYNHALTHDYRFLSYGDSSLLLR